MKITLYLRYNSQWGEEVFIEGDTEALRSSDGAGLPLEYTEQGWKITFYTNDKTFRYHFYICKFGNKVRTEESLSHTFSPLSKEYNTILIYDTFNAYPTIGRMEMSATFQKAIRNHSEKPIKRGSEKIPFIFKTVSTKVNHNHELAIVGDASVVGKWEEDAAVPLNPLQYPHFAKVLDGNKIDFPLKYKYVIRDPKNKVIQSWEAGDNHYLMPDFSISTDIVIVNDPEPDFALPAFKAAGTVVPIFSLRTKDSFGVGEFNDLKKLADWCEKTGQRIIQTLPINDTSNFGTWRDSYPYNAISVYALHPMYLNIDKIGKVKDQKKYKAQKKELNEEIFVNYEAVNKYKWIYYHELYDLYAKETFKTEDFKKFMKEQEDWLKPYAVFCFLHHKFSTTDFSHWGRDADYDAKRVESYCDPSNMEYDHVAIHFFVQYHLHKQLKEAVDYAHTKGVALKGDIPIGVSPCSVDVWKQPDLFDRNGCAGAPPDYFTRTGQVWGFPIYNWDKMEEDGYQWWKRRLSVMSEYFDAYRIDHILGFFRIFRTPTDSHYGLLGQFTPTMPLSIEEIENFGLKFDKKKFTEPLINDTVVDNIFGKKANEVRNKYLISDGNGFYHLKPEYSTQAKIDEHISSDPTNVELKKGLYLLCCQVLFVEDYKEKDKYHPRISLTTSFVFPTLPQEMRDKLSYIYEYFHFSRHNDFWHDGAKRKLSAMINSTNMMVCAEDLGMVPPCVAPVMRELQILCLEIQRMPKQAYVEFDNLSRIPRFSVCTTSTHDMSTMRQWWETERDSVQRYFSNELHQFGGAPFFCEPWIVRQIIENHLKSPAAWVILPIQDWMATDGKVRWSETFKERINDPGDPNNYWRYRIHINLEELIANDEFNERIRNMIIANAR